MRSDFWQGAEGSSAVRVEVRARYRGKGKKGTGCEVHACPGLATQHCVTVIKPVHLGGSCMERGCREEQRAP